MRALVKLEKGIGHVELKDDWPKPAAKEGWVIVEVVGCGICGTDLHILEDTHKNWPPVVMGHEYTGRIVEVGVGVVNWKVGDRVVCEQHTLACGTCNSCRRGAIHLCQAKRSPGWGIDGAFADFVSLPANLLHKVPDGVSFLAATVCEPTAICITGLDRVNLQSGERVLVIGPGPIGLISALLAKASGASSVTVLGRSSSSERLELAKKLGIKTYELRKNSNPIDDLGADFDVAIDSTGAGDSLSLAIKMTRRQGRVLQLGLASVPEVNLALNDAMYRSLEIHFSMSSEYSSWDRALSLMASGNYDPIPLTSIYSLGDWKNAFQDVEHRKVVKAVITPKDPETLNQTK
jgi:L-iditol 2-dehydrogenase